MLRRLGSPRVLPLAPLCSPAAPQRPTPTREPGGCWEAQAPTQHHFLLSLWCRARPGQGDTGAPQDTQVAQVQKEKQAGTAWARGHASTPPALSNHLGAPRSSWIQIPVNSHGRGRGAQPCNQGPAEDRGRAEPQLPGAEAAGDGREPGAAQPLCPARVPPPGDTPKKENPSLYLCQFDLKEKRSFFGQRKDYWDFLCQGLARCRQEHEGIHFVTSLDKLKTPVGRGRAFLRYCLVHRQLAESLQLCLLDPESLCEWYYARSPFLSPKWRAEILGSLYELDCVTFHLALHRDDLDTAWPMFSETLVRPSPVIRSSPAKTALQTDSIGTVARGRSDGIAHPTVAPHGAPAHPCPPTLAALQAGSVEMEDIEGDVEDVEVKKDMEEEAEEEVEKDDSEDIEEVKVEDVEVDVEKDVEEDLEEKDEELEEDEKEMEDLLVDVEELEDAHGTGKAPQPDGAGEPGMSPLPTGTRCMLGSRSLVPRQLGGTEASLQALVSQLRAELGQRKAAAQALAARLARAELRHQQREESSARRAQLWAREAEALRETNTFLERALEAAVAAGDRGALAQAEEEARGWQEVAEERGTQLARVLAEVTALTSRLQECQAALVAAGRTNMLEDARASDEVAAVEKVLQQALELARGPQESPPDPKAEGGPSTVTSMAMCLASLAATAREETWQSRQQLQAQRQEMARLQEELSRARQDGERWASALQRAQREALEREATRGAEQARQQELIRDMKERLLELLREKDALWQKTEGIDTPVPRPVPRDPGLCARCHKDFRLLSRRYNCRLCQQKVCHTCSMDMGKHGRCCLICYQQRHPQAT